MTTTPPDDRERESLVTLRTAVILLLALLAGIAVGVLARLAGRTTPEALILAGSTTAAGIPYFNKIIS